MKRLQKTSFTVHWFRLWKKFCHRGLGRTRCFCAILCINVYSTTTPEKYSSLKNIHPWKIFTPEKYSPLKNSHHWKIFTPGRLNDWAHKHWMLGWYILVIFCSLCGKEAKRTNMKNHIEANHLEGISVPCNQCEKTFRSRNSLSTHKSAFHKHTPSTPSDMF